MIKDYYAILGVEKNATKEEIKRAFRRLARRYHPDVNPKESKSGEKFKEISEAHKILSDEERRKKYNIILEINLKSNSEKFNSPIPKTRRTWIYKANNFGTQTIRESSSQKIHLNSYKELNSHEENLDVFNNLKDFRVYSKRYYYSGMHTEEGRKDGDDLKYDLEITFSEAFKGGEKKVWYFDPLNGIKKYLLIRFERGIQDGHKMRLKGRGLPGINGGEAGDLYIIFHVKPHPRYRRILDDLIIKQEIPYSTAILGDKIKISSLDEDINVIVPPLTKDGTLLRIKEKGFYNSNLSKRGSLLVKIKISIPDQINSYQEELIKKLKNIGL